MRRLGLAGSCVALVLSTGCFWVTTKHEGEELRTDVDKLDKRVGTQEEALGGKVEKLQQILDQATKLLTRNSADLGAEVSSMAEDNAKLTGLVMDAKRLAEELRDASQKQDARLSALEDRITALEEHATEVPSKSASDLYAEGNAAMTAGDYEKAKAAWKTLVVKYPSDDKADDAQLGRGEANYKQGNFQDALTEFQKVFEKFPTSPLADDALFRAGESAEQLKWCTDARAYYGLLRQKYPKSDLLKKAKDKDATLKKAAKDKKKCAS